MRDRFALCGRALHHDAPAGFHYIPTPYPEPIALHGDPKEERRVQKKYCSGQYSPKVVGTGKHNLLPDKTRIASHRHHCWPHP